jgi:hypothetical protein
MCNNRGSISVMRPPVKLALVAAMAIVTFQMATASAQTAFAVDPTIGFDRLFGLGGHTCKQYDDIGRLFLYTEGLPATNVTAWLQMSDNGTKPNVPMPQELEAALPRIPGCMPGRHHAASTTG